MIVTVNIGVRKEDRDNLYDALSDLRDDTPFIREWCAGMVDGQLVKDREVSVSEAVAFFDTPATVFAPRPATAPDEAEQLPGAEAVSGSPVADLIGEEIIVLSGFELILSVRDGIVSNSGSMPEMVELLQHLKVERESTTETVWVAQPTMPRAGFKLLNLYIGAFCDGQASAARRVASAYKDSGTLAKQTVVALHDEATTSRAGNDASLPESGPAASITTLKP